MTWHRSSPDRISETAALGLLRGMLEIPSPSYHEADLANYLVVSLRELGFSAYIDRVGNVVGEIDRGAGPVVMLLGHLDTIPSEIPVRSVDGRIYGRGAADAKSPLAAMICAAASAVGFRGRTVLVGAVEEETPQSRGAMEIRRTHPRPDMVIVGEPSGWSSVVLGYKGKLDLRLRARCAPSHPSNPASKASELVAAGWVALLDELGPDASNASFDRPGAALCSISGDLAGATADLSVRTPVGFDVDGLLDRLAARVRPAEITVVNSVAACRADRYNPVVRALTAGIRTQHGNPTMKLKTATSDMNTLAEVWDVPMATYGPGDSRLDHSDDEYISIAEYFRGIAVLTWALEEMDVGAHGGPDPSGRRIQPV